MNSKLKFADAFRLIARILSIPLLANSVCFIIFVGAEGLAEGGAIIGVLLLGLSMLAIFGGLIIAWRKEGLGSIITLGAILIFILGGLILGSFDLKDALQDSSPFAGPLHLFFALVIPGYHLEVTPIAKWVPLISWILVLIPVGLFLASWTLRRENKKSSDNAL